MHSVIDKIRSDHLTIEIELDQIHNSFEQNTTKQITMINWKRFSENLENTPLEINEDIKHLMELDLAVKHLTETIQYILKLSTNNKT